MYQRTSRAGILSLVGGLALAMSSLAVRADFEADYKAGVESFSRGDVVSAMTTLKKAVESGHAPSQWLYGYILDGTDEDAEAVEYYRKAAVQNHPPAQFSLGAAYLSGEGVKQNPEEGHKWIRLAAENGHGAAINQMALFSMRDAAAGKQDNDTALRWIRAAAEGDFIPAMEAMAQAYRTGGYGLQQDDKLAAQWDAKVLKVKGLDTKTRKRKGAAK